MLHILVRGKILLSVRLSFDSINEMKAHSRTSVAGGVYVTAENHGDYLLQHSPRLRKGQESLYNVELKTYSYMPGFCTILKRFISLLRFGC
jgi:hypothetical protein